MKKWGLFVLLLCFAFAGCSHLGVQNDAKTQTQKIDLGVYEQVVVSNYVDKYMLSTNANNIVISIILREISVAYITNNIRTWDDFFAYQDRFFENIATNIISSQYPIRASSGDVDLTSGYVGDISKTTFLADPSLLSEMKRILPKFSNILIFKINDYEYEKRQDK